MYQLCKNTVKVTILLKLFLLKKQQQFSERSCYTNLNRAAFLKRGDVPTAQNFCGKRGEREKSKTMLLESFWRQFLRLQLYAA